ncbi:MAG: DNA-processing protein DprA, partial [Pseudomonadota bacterium]
MSGVRELEHPINGPRVGAPRRARATIDPAERLARLRLVRSQNVGPRTYAQLIRRFGTAARAVESLPTLAARGGRSDYDAAPLAAIEAELAQGHAMGAHLLTMGEPGYPALLAMTEPTPPVLWVIGNLDLFQQSSVAIVGARNASAVGQRTARRLARDLGAAGHVIVSGLARGIDAAAHEASIGTGTIAVLAGGLDQIYPPENQGLAARIAESGLLVSEVAFGTAPMAKHFPRRNRLISGLARGVVLIEAADRSGSLITAQFALEQGRDVMA